MPNFGTNTCCLLTYLKIRKIEGGKISLPTHQPTHPHNSGLRPSLCKGWVAGPRREHDRIWHENKKRTKKQKSTWNPIFSKIAHNSLNNGRRAVLIPFLDFQYFWTFWRFLLLKSLFFYHFFWKKYKVSEGRRQLFHQEIFQPFPRGKSLLNFFNLKILNLLITP